MKRIYSNISLASRNSFGVEQQATTLVEFECAEDLRDYFEEHNPEKWYVLGAGNNTLFMQDYDGVLFTPVNRKRTILSSLVRRTTLRLSTSKYSTMVIASLASAP